MKYNGRFLNKRIFKIFELNSTAKHDYLTDIQTVKSALCLNCLFELILMQFQGNPARA